MLDQIKHWVKDHIQTAQSTLLNPESLFHGLRWIQAAPGQVRLQVAPQWLGTSPSRYTGTLILAAELAVEEALRLEERMNGITVLFVGSQSELIKARRGPCEIRFRIPVNEMEQLRLEVLREKTLAKDFVLTLWTQDEAQIGTVTLQVRLQLQPYLSA